MGTRVLKDFEYLRPRSIKDGLSMLREHGEKASILAGGTDLLIAMKCDLVQPEILIDITGIGELKGITFDKGGLRIGAGTLLSELERHRLIEEKYTTLFEAISQMATVQVRNIATIGGNLCNASPAADTAPPFLVLDATVDISTRSGVRTVRLEEFFSGPNKTVLAPGEILRGISVTPPSESISTSFTRMSRTSSDLAIVNTAVALQTKNGICQDAKIALGAVAPIPMRAKKAETLLRDRRLDQDALSEAASMIVEEIRPITDLRSTAIHRKDVAVTMTKRALVKAYERIQKL